MNLWLRLIITIIKCFFAPKNGLLDASCLSFRISPLDCDINIHLTNSRYFSFMDLGRLYLIANMKGVFKVMLKERWAPVISGIDIKFIRSVTPFQKIQLKTHLLTWDNKYLYLEQRFMDKKKLYAVALVKGVFLRKGEIVPMSEILKIMGLPINTQPPQKSASLLHWQALSDAKRKEEN